MLQDALKVLPPLATLASVTAGDETCALTYRCAEGDRYLYDTVRLDGPMRICNGMPDIPLNFFRDVMHAYVTVSDTCVTVERSGCIAAAPLTRHCGADYVPACDLLAQMNVDYHWEEDFNRLDVLVETRTAGPRQLTPSELALPYAKYYTGYWDTPFHLRPDTLAWDRKSSLYQLSAMSDPKQMLHIRDVRKLLDADYRKSGWKEGWTLFEDGSGVMCLKTEFPGTTCDMFEWWFAWHVQEDLRYMLWFPPAHYGIAPTLEYRKKLADPNRTIFEKTHGGDAIHLVYESTQIDALSYVASKPIAWRGIPFHNPQVRGFLDEDLDTLAASKCVAICGGQRMLHFFAENEDGTGGTLYTHFWFGIYPDGPGAWKGMKSEPDPELIQPILNIAQHATKEFANLAHILPRIYSEEGGKPF